MIIMPKRRIILANNEIYHIYNKSVANEEIFGNKRNINFTLKLINYYRYPQKLRFSKFKILGSDARKTYWEGVLTKNPFVEIFAYSILPNHYHLLLKQLSDNGIRKFIANFQNSFAKYFNIKYDRRGSLFLNAFRGKRVDNDNILLHVSRYIHLNPVTSYLINLHELENEATTSFPIYMGKKYLEFVNPELIWGIMGSKEKYKKFVFDQEDYQKRLSIIKSFIQR